MAIIEIEIIKWKKHQRKDVARPSWFAMDNRILEDVKLFDLSDAEWKALLYIFSQASQQNSQAVILNTVHAERVCGVKEKTILSTISRLCDVGVTRTARERVANYPLQDKTGQDKTGQDTNPNGLVCTVSEKPEPMPTEVLSSEGLIKIIPEKVLGLYEPGFVARESIKAWAWLEANGAKRPKSVKGLKRFFSTWLERGWERARKSLPSNRPDLDLHAIPLKDYSTKGTA